MILEDKAFQRKLSLKDGAPAPSLGEVVPGTGRAAPQESSDATSAPQPTARPSSDFPLENHPEERGRQSPGSVCPTLPTSPERSPPPTSTMLCHLWSNLLVLKLIYNYYRQLLLHHEAQELPGVIFYRFAETLSLIQSEVFQVVLKGRLQALGSTPRAQPLDAGGDGKVTCPTNGTRTSR